MHRWNKQIQLGALLALCLALATPFATAQNNPQTVLWAGIAFRGTVSDTQELLPVTKSVVDDVGLVRLNEMAWDGFQRVTRDDIRFSRSLGEATSGNAIALALALDFEQFGESVVTTADESNVCGRNRLWAQILVFDFTDKKLIGAFPLSAVSQHCERGLAAIPDAQKAVLAQELLMGGTSGSLLAKFEQRLQSLQLNSGWQANIKVTEVSLGKYTKQMLGRSDWSQPAYRRWLAATFAASLSERQHVPVLPYSLGGAIAGAMPLRFSDTEAYDIALPPENYGIKLNARGYVEKVLDESKFLVAKSHIFSLGIDIYDPDFGDHFFDENMSIARTGKYAKTDSIDDIQIYEEITAVLVDGFLAQFPKPDKGWVKQHVKSEQKWKALKKALVAVEVEVFSNLRGD